MSILISNFLSHNTSHRFWGLNKPRSFQFNTQRTGTQICVNMKVLVKVSFALIAYFVPELHTLREEAFGWWSAVAQRLQTKNRRGNAVLHSDSPQIWNSIFLLVLDPVHFRAWGWERKSMTPLTESLYLLFFFSTPFLSRDSVYLFWTPTLFLQFLKSVSGIMTPLFKAWVVFNFYTAINSCRVSLTRLCASQTFLLVHLLIIIWLLYFLVHDSP